MTVIDLTKNIPSDIPTDTVSVNQGNNEPQLELPTVPTKPAASKKRVRPLNLSNNSRTVEIKNNKFQLNQPIMLLGEYFETRAILTESISIESVEKWLETQFSDLIGYLATESPLNINQLAIFIKSILCPITYNVEEDPFNNYITLDFIKSTLLKIGKFTQYNLIIQNFENLMPSNLTVTRFELDFINNNEKFQKFINFRKGERNRLLKEAQELLDNLSLQDKLNLFQAGLNSEEFELVKSNLLNNLTQNLDSSQQAEVVPQPVQQQPKTAPPPLSQKPEKPQQPKIQGFFKSIAKPQVSDQVDEVKPLENASDYDKFFLKFRVKNFVKLANLDLPIKDDLIDKLNDVKLDDYNKLSKRDKISSIFNSATRPTPKKDQNSIKFKLLHFSEDYRPPYFGAFNRSSNIISGRGWNKKDESQLDYEVDSELEWEEEDGEVLDSSDGESDDDEDEVFSDNSSEQEGDWISDDPDNEDSEDDDELETPHVHKPSMKRIKIATQLIPEAIPPTLLITNVQQKSYGKIAGGYQFNIEEIQSPLDPRGSPIPEIIKIDSSSTDNIKINKSPASKLNKDLETKSSTPSIDNIKPYKPPVSKLAKAPAVDPSTPAKWTKETEKKLKDLLHGNISRLNNLTKYLKSSKFPQFSEDEIKEKVLELASFEVRPQKLTPAWYLK
ncbi:hypothetical protein CONCODRAFT_67488 [Conidiobolus coronatus NRRL 28638]|uniref:Chromatin assembly factor 1 subunit A dimerization domain-containing protein n=1 Tax=Conidiobolus coronatus (strain ATCC 28846 / CBS 209.66 / NRRL 28638) TaxID=796925 RepID=A0A137PHJ3_CONC2|nr:hypothetical protein CONCODRAFT_67488 [Conidiobolus coronatus NRRL 28638]|eukprot:KXN74450.1 hypothetical protein CONCODRAFT_67488 [Conidiobolus coronatus NRRL 28638]